MIIKTGTSRTSGTSISKKCFKLAPPTKSMLIIVTPTQIVIDMFGSIIMRRHMSEPAKIVGKIPRKLLTFLLACDKLAEANKTNPNFAISLGCKVKNPRFIHLFAPYTFTPICGMKTSARSTADNMIETHFSFFSFS